MPWHPPAPACAAPALRGTVVDVRVVVPSPARAVVFLVPAPAAGPPRARVLLSAGTVPAGRVSLRVRNDTDSVRELVVLPLPVRATAGARPALGDGRVNDAGAVARVSAGCGAGPGAGLPPGGLGWVEVSVDAGSLELVCNEDGDYAGGTRATLGTRPAP